MGENERKVIEISPSSNEKTKTPKVKEEGTSLKPMFCLKKNVDMHLFDESEDCYILDFDPFRSIDLSKLSISGNDNDDDDDLRVVAESGKVACRDYPHSRHLCVKFPFENTPHENYCEQCYCYVCDLAAPCEFWTQLQLAHCNATEHIEDWKLQRQSNQQLRAHKK